MQVWQGFELFVKHIDDYLLGWILMDGFFMLQFVYWQFAHKYVKHMHELKEKDESVQSAKRMNDAACYMYLFYYFIW